MDNPQFASLFKTHDMQKSNPKKKILKEQTQDLPGLEKDMDPAPEFDNGMPGSGKMEGKKCIITGGDSGIGRAVAVSFAKEGADVAIIHLPQENEDAEFTVKYISDNFKRKCINISTDLSKEENCRKAAGVIIKSFSRVDVLVNNAAVQYPVDDIIKISSDKLLETFSVNILAMFWMTQSVLESMPEGSAIINTTSVTAYRGSGGLLDYSSTKGAIVSFTRSLSANLVSKGIRVNGVAPGPIWTPLIPATFPAEHVAKFGSDVPMARPGQPSEVAPAFVFLASKDSSYVTGQIIHVNGGEIVNG